MIKVESYDDVIELIEIFLIEYSIKVDKDMPNVWWITVLPAVTPSYMITNLERIYNVEKE